MSKKSLLSRVGGAVEKRAVDMAKWTLEHMRGGTLGAFGSGGYSGGVSAAGLPVNHQNVISLPAVFRALATMGDSVGMSPMILYKRTADGKERAREHQLYDIIRNVAYESEDGGLLTAMEFKSQIQAQALIFGNGYAKVFRDRNGGVTGLWPLFPPYMRRRMEIKDGKLFYVYSENGNTEHLEPRDVFHLPGFSLRGVMGLDPVETCKDSFGLGLALTDYASKFFKHGTWMSGVLSTDQVLGVQQKKDMKIALSEGHTGPEGWQRFFVADAGLKYTQATVSPEDAQALESRLFLVQDVARVMGIPPSMLMDLSHATKSNAEQQSLQFRAALVPWGERWAQRVQMTLLTKKERKKYLVGFNWRKLDQADRKSIAESNNLDIQSGIATPDEFRLEQDLNPLPDGQGAFARFPLQSIPADKAEAYGEKVTTLDEPVKVDGDDGSGGDGGGGDTGDDGDDGDDE